jgi:hypothetical protein
VTSDFTAATWNVEYSSPVKTLRPILNHVLELNVSLLLVQEALQPEQRQMFLDAGLDYFWNPKSNLVVWKPDTWVPIDHRGVFLSEASWLRKGGGRNRSNAAVSILSDKAGRTLTTMSYHDPAHVQRAEPTQGRWDALVQGAKSKREVAKAAQTRACLFGGDDNVDEARGFGPWNFMLRGPLTQIQAPRATHGAKRKIDDFRISSGLRAGNGLVLPGGGDHRIHIRDFLWS